VTVSVLPLEVPDEIEVSIDGLENIGDNIRVEDLILPDGVVAISSPDQVVARIAMTRTAAVEVGEGMEVEEGEEGAEGAEGAEGEEGEE
jgi:large subunit ribosomal protein L25